MDKKIINLSLVFSFLLLQQLQERLAALTEENDQLKTDAKENVEMVKTRLCLWGVFGDVVPGQNDPKNHSITCPNFMQMIEIQAELREELAKRKDLEGKVQKLNAQKNQLESKVSQTDRSDESKVVEDLKLQVSTWQIRLILFIYVY